MSDASVQDGQPVECYRFSVSGSTYRYTSYHRAVVLGEEPDEEEFAPLAISSSQIEMTIVLDTLLTLNVTVPAQSEIARVCGFGDSPQTVRLELLRFHLGAEAEVTTEFQGDIAGVSTQDAETTIRFGSVLQNELFGNIATVMFQQQCNHVLYDPRCGVVKADFTTSSTVTAIKGRTVTVASDGVADNALAIGTAFCTRTGENRSIVSNVSDVITLVRPFYDLQVGDTLEMSLGCDHIRTSHCKLRFNNVPRYGGHDFIPAANPFVTKGI
jgi:hypothetical protein